MIPKQKTMIIICYGITFLMVVSLVLLGLFGNTADGTGWYSTLTFYVVLPITSLVCALILSICSSRYQWMYPIVVGVMGYAIPLLVFGGVLLPFFQYLFFSFVPAFVGIGIGFFIKKLFLPQ